MGALGVSKCPNVRPLWEGFKENTPKSATLSTTLAGLAAPPEVTKSRTCFSGAIFALPLRLKKGRRGRLTDPPPREKHTEHRQ